MSRIVDMWTKRTTATLIAVASIIIFAMANREYCNFRGVFKPTLGECVCENGFTGDRCAELSSPFTCVSTNKTDNLYRLQLVKFPYQDRNGVDLDECQFIIDALEYPYGEQPFVCVSHPNNPSFASLDYNFIGMPRRVLINQLNGIVNVYDNDESGADQNNIWSGGDIFTAGSEPMTINSIEMSYEVCNYISSLYGLPLRNIPLQCSNNPCLNGGVCKDNNYYEYECGCSREWVGKNCQIPNACINDISNPCFNDGKCGYDIEQNQFRCMCRNGFYGSQCQCSHKERLTPAKCIRKCRIINKTPVYSLRHTNGCRQVCECI